MSQNPLAELSAGPNEKVLVVDTDNKITDSFSTLLSSAGYGVAVADSAAGAIVQATAGDFEVIIASLELGDMSGLELVRELRSRGIISAVILVAAETNVSIMLDAIRVGAYDCLAKPISGDELLLAIRKARERDRLKVENALLRDQVSKRFSFHNIVSKNDQMLSLFETVKKIAQYKTTVMIYGESGTGKELIAQAIHYNSDRRSKRFVAINCGAIPENLLESELFGHKRGSFTDATRDKKGLFEEAEGGTLLLDEVGELPLHLQVKLLRVLQENEIRPVGDNRAVPIDVRIIAATLRDLEHDVALGRFRDDLYYRLNVISLKIPPLRERREDIPLLVNYFLKRNQEKLGLGVYGIKKDAMAALMEHTWPGNIRELENCIERAMILTEGEEITRASLPQAVFGEGDSSAYELISSDELSIKVHSRAVEERLIQKALEKTKGNRTHAAKLLEISHRTLLYKLKEYKLAGEQES